MVDSLVESLSILSHELTPIHQRLIQIRRQLAAIAARPKPNKSEIQTLQDELRKIDSYGDHFFFLGSVANTIRSVVRSKRVDGKFLVGSNVPRGQAILAGLLESNFEIAQDIAARQEDVAMPLKPIYDRLSDMRAQLERLALTHRWTLRETVSIFFILYIVRVERNRPPDSILCNRTCTISKYLCKRLMVCASKESLSTAKATSPTASSFVPPLNVRSQRISLSLPRCYLPP
jgi:hypothetical protein